LQRLLATFTEEIREACAVAISLGGTMGAGEATRDVQLLAEKGLLNELKKDT
jgi:hypothetical protein